MRVDWCKYEGEAVLLVEGVNDCHVILALCEMHHVPENFGIYECGSDALALKRMNALIVSASPPRTIGLIVDADNPDLAGRWASIKAKLAPQGYSLPPEPAESGTIIQSETDLPRLGFWLMPNNRITGMLEDFCNEMISETMLTTVEKCLDIAIADGCTTFKATHRSKAIVHTFLAWQDEPGKPLGQAVKARLLHSDTVTAQRFVQWMIDLFAA